jgi:hypothetical protein
MTTREKINERIPNINWFQLLGLNNFTKEVLDLKRKFIILLVTRCQFPNNRPKIYKISPYRP